MPIVWTVVEADIGLELELVAEYSGVDSLRSAEDVAYVTGYHKKNFVWDEHFADVIGYLWAFEQMGCCCC